MSWKTRLLTRRVYRPRGYHLVTCRLLVTWLEFSFQKHAALIFSCLQEHPSSAVISSKALGIFFFFFPPTQQKTKSTCRLLFFGKTSRLRLPPWEPGHSPDLSSPLGHLLHVIPRGSAPSFCSPAPYPSHPRGWCLIWSSPPQRAHTFLSCPGHSVLRCCLSQVIILYLITASEGHNWTWVTNPVDKSV